MAAVLNITRSNQFGKVEAFMEGKELMSGLLDAITADSDAAELEARHRDQPQNVEPALECLARVAADEAMARGFASALTGYLAQVLEGCIPIRGEDHKDIYLRGLSYAEIHDVREPDFARAAQLTQDLERATLLALGDAECPRQLALLHGLHSAIHQAVAAPERAGLRTWACSYLEMLEESIRGTEGAESDSRAVHQAFKAIARVQEALGVCQGRLAWDLRDDSNQPAADACSPADAPMADPAALVDAKCYCKDARALLPLLRAQIEADAREVVLLSAFEESLTTALEADAVTTCWGVLGAAKEIFGCYLNAAAPNESDTFGGLVEGITSCVANAITYLEPHLGVARP